MKIRILRNLGIHTGLPAFSEGQLVDADQSAADDLVKNGLAEIVEEPPTEDLAKPGPLPKAKAPKAEK